jgi:hypothetical protein
VMKATGSYPRIQVDTAGPGVVSHAGGALLVETVRASGLDRALSAGLARWRKPNAVHDPAKVLTDLAIALALGGDCLANVALLRAEKPRTPRWRTMPGHRRARPRNDRGKSAGSGFESLTAHHKS